MEVEVFISPSGRLGVENSRHGESTAATSPSVDIESLRHAFDESPASGLFQLALIAPGVELSPSLVYWREFSHRLFHELCGLGEETLARAAESARTAAIGAPDASKLAALVQGAPPMRGLEYLSTELLRRFWDELQELALDRALEFAGGPAAFLKSLNPLWNLLGRVTFHLAENKRDAGRPFAFLATYTHRLSAGVKLRHLSLAEALRQYAGEQNQTRLAALLAPVQRAAEQSAVVRELLDSRGLFQPQAWTIRQAHRFLVDVPRMEECGLVVRVPDWWNARRPPRPQVQVRIGQQRSGHVGLNGLLDFSTELAIDGEPLTEAERQQILATTDGLTLLRGRWVEVDRQKLQQALDHWRKIEDACGDGVDFIQGMRLLAGVRLAEEVHEEGASDWTRVVAGDWLSQTLAQLRDPSGVLGCEPGRDLLATLRPYQADGVRWLWFMSRLGLGACLADDMGLGKTIQVIDLLLTLKREDQAGGRSNSSRTSLLVVPASLVGNWKQEFERFAPTIRVLYAHPSECDANLLKQIGQDAGKAVDEFDAVVTTYGLLRRVDWFAQRAWRLAILDEAQAVKNASSSQAQAVRKLRSSGRIVLTGTPVENNLGELRSLFEFCCPGLLGSAAEFKRYIKRLNRRQDADGYGALRRLVRPYILRRLKSDPDIAPDLPDKTEMRTDCGLSKKQATLYEQALEDLARLLKQSDGIQRRGVVLAALMRLKQICNHPALYLRHDDYPPTESGKFQRLALLCEPIVERQERALIFTQFQSLTEPLAGFLSGVFGRRGLVLHGGVPVKKRRELVREFQRDDGPPFFVISVKAGGTGLNLTAASHVMHFDRWWNPAVENQATDRAFRIGQKRNVLVHKFVCRGTVEERIDAMIRDKRELAEQILGGGAETLLTELSDRELLKFVALDLSRAAADE